VVEAFVVLQPGIEGGEVLTREHQELVKQAALHKYPRAVEYVDALPRTETGKLQRFRLRQLEEQRASERGTA
jgi:2-aminobenzoate-CoA ligase